jgi:hypothetical protein
MTDDLVERWIKHHAEKRRSPAPLFEAWREVDELVRVDPEAGWLLALDLVAASPDDQALAAIAAGPLEDLLCRWSDLLIDRVEAEARRDAKFRRCLTGAWGSSTIPAATKDRIAKYTSTVKDPL